MDDRIIPLDPKDYEKCGNIWDMHKDPERTGKWYDEIVSGNRRVYVCVENGAFIGEGALVFENADRDYTIPHQRVYLSRLIVCPDCRRRGVGGRLLDELTGAAGRLWYREISLGVDKANVSARRLYEQKGFTTVVFDGEDETGT